MFPQVTMADRAAADRACKDPNPIIDGRKANVNLAYLGAKPRSLQTGESLSFLSSPACFYIQLWNLSDGETLPPLPLCPRVAAGNHVPYRGSPGPPPLAWELGPLPPRQCMVPGIPTFKVSSWGGEKLREPVSFLCFDTF